MIPARPSLFYLAAQLIFSTAICAAEPFDGDWAGGFQSDGVWTPLLIHLNTNGHDESGTADLLKGFVIGQRLDAIAVDANRVRFKVDKGDLHLTFDGELKDNTIVGLVRRGGSQSTFRLDRVIKSDPNGFAGTYELAPNHYFIMNSVPAKFEGVSLLFCLDTQSGLARPLFPISKNSLISGPCFGEGPAESSVEFSVDDRDHVGLKFTSKRDGSFIGHAVTLREEKITLENGDVKLAGSLVLPFSPGPYPAIVFVHGSGPSSRNDYRLLASYFAANGVACLIYDKRGVGESTGSWETAGFNEFAGDALAGIAKLKTRADIEPRNIGLCGMSQAGWVMPLAASRSADVTFIISLSGAGVSPEEQGAYMVEHRVRAEHFGDAEVAEALALYRLDSRCARIGSGWDQLKAAVAQARKKPWFHFEFVPQNRASASQWQAICDFDPVPVLHKVRCPVLAILGGMDPLVPTEKSAAVWKSALTEGNNSDALVQVFPYAEHGLSDPALGTQHPEFFTMQLNWLRQHLHPSP